MGVGVSSSTSAPAPAVADVLPTPQPQEKVQHSESESPAKEIPDPKLQEALSRDEEIARALQEEEYAAARLANATGGNGNRPTPALASGIISHRSVPGDHSCLFSAIAYVAEGPDKVNPGKARELREVCAQNVLNDPDPAKRATLLGVSNVEEYAKWIRDPEHWGGENEIIVLAKHYNIELAVV